MKIMTRIQAGIAPQKMHLVGGLIVVLLRILTAFIIQNKILRVWQISWTTITASFGQHGKIGGTLFEKHKCGFGKP